MIEKDDQITDRLGRVGVVAAPEDRGWIEVEWRGADEGDWSLLRVSEVTGVSRVGQLDSQGGG